MLKNQLIRTESTPQVVLARTAVPRPDWQCLADCSTAPGRGLLRLVHAQRLCCLPLAVWMEGDGKVLSVLVAAPLTAALSHELRFITGCDIVFELASRESLERAIVAAYCGSPEYLRRRLEGAEASITTRSSVAEARALKSDEPVPLLLEAVLERADSLSASDIHLEPNDNGVRLRFRVDGRLCTDTAFMVSSGVAANMFRRIKLLASLDGTCDFKPQEGGFTFSLGKRELRLRVSFVPQHHGEKVVIRVLENNLFAGLSASESSFRRLGLTYEQEKLFLAHLGAASGAILLAGPTGSGKSTLLYAALEHLNADWRNVVTLEDPVERTIPGINQLDVARGGELSYAELLPALLRQDPDVLMIGEIRDCVTGETALSAAITGHLVLSTVHAGTALEVLPRLIQLGLQPQLLSCSLRLLVAQRLLPLNCLHCRKAAQIPELWRKILCLGNERVYSGTGCAKCRGKGIEGRIGIYEFLPIGPRTREKLWDGEQGGICSLSNFGELAKDEGYEPLAYGIRKAVLQGEVAPKHALRTLGIAVEIGTDGYQGSDF